MAKHATAPTPHISAKVGDIAETILLPGDPLRAKFIAEHYLEDAVQFNSVRNMFGYTGTYQGKRVSVMGTGMGCPSMGIYSWELIHVYGCKNLIRIGTAGTWQPYVHVRDVVFAQGSCTTSNYPALQGLPGTFAPICSFELLEKAVAKAKEMGLHYHVGNVLSSDVFYGEELPHAKTFRDMGVLAVEMESAALYTNAAAGGAKALCILTISDGPDEVTTSQERETSFTQMMEIALSLS
ncbi:MAG: purine-nucleoside phosphorylase [Lachnospiraceae bacterium]|uniref:purine-nucleoside phosphorylase n=1 Tax=Galactobacillus timonensis TaxID=2041840 RepID=UPI0023EFD4CF|nr:purine-nucleoside phosphorylase [Galactobacillus timonensis]MDD7086099.1 purine-nucleoside phosphorylase [Galactobacillus timonensis]MDY5222412.1 purine-nucleoside phosphorylase [Lachnospiraceae bacterium]